MNNIVYKISMDGMSDAEARAAVALQGLANRYDSNIFLVPGRERSVWSQVDKKRFVSDTFSDEELEKYPDVEAYWIEYFSKAYGFEFKESGFEETFSTFKGYVKGCVKYDEATSGTIVFTMAGLFDALPVTDALIQKYPELNNLPVIYDITGKFKDKYEAHEWAVNEFLEKTNKQFASSSFTEAEGGTVQNDYAVMNKAFVFQMNFLSQENLRHAVEWEQKTYDPKAEPIVDKIFEHIDKFGFIWGWGDGGENAIASRCALNGMVLLCANTPNASFIASIKPNKKNELQIKQKASAVKKEDIKNKMYISFMVNEGDTYKYAYSMANFASWQQGARGRLPVNWGVDPLVFDLFPAIKEFYYSTKTDKDYFFAATSGYGYLHPNYLNPEFAEEYAEKIKSSNADYGIEYVDIWWMKGMRDKDGNDITWDWYAKTGAKGLTFWDGRNNTTFEAGPVINSQLYYPLNEISNKSDLDNAANVISKVLIEAQSKLQQDLPFLCVFYAGDPAAFERVLKQLPEDRFEAVTLDKLFSIAEIVGDRLSDNKAEYNITTEATAVFSPMR